MSDDYQLISAIMIVDGLPVSDILWSIDCFQQQTYPNRELIIVNNAKSQYQAASINIPASSGVFLVDTPAFLSAGHARNFGISAANGQILAQFDADCWHAPNRLEQQARSMVANTAHISMLTSTLQYSYNSGVARYWQNDKQAILNTMMFIRPPDLDYPAVEHGEEFGLLQKMLQAGYTAVSLQAPELVCKLHRSADPINQPVMYQVEDAHKHTIDNILLSRGGLSPEQT